MVVLIFTYWKYFFIFDLPKYQPGRKVEDLSILPVRSVLDKKKKKNMMGIVKSFHRPVQNLKSTSKSLWWGVDIPTFRIPSYGHNNEADDREKACCNLASLLVRSGDGW